MPASSADFLNILQRKLYKLSSNSDGGSVVLSCLFTKPRYETFYYVSFYYPQSEKYHNINYVWPLPKVAISATIQLCSYACFHPVAHLNLTALVHLSFIMSCYSRILVATKSTCCCRNIFFSQSIKLYSKMFRNLFQDNDMDKERGGWGKHINVAKSMRK